MEITKIRIKNFRSILDQTFDVNRMNIFVGLNDCGKSNILRALNLFFNGQTDFNKDFNLDEDLSYLRPPTSKSAKEVEVIITFRVPDSYTERGYVIWRKCWRSTGLYSDEIKKEDGTSVPARSRIPTALGRIKFRYVPAIKSNRYFSYLLGDLYETLSNALDATFNDSIQSLSDVLKQQTQELSNTLKDIINIDSIIDLPNNLRILFETLQFRTRINNNERTVSLEQRGDGIKAFHIPVILNYIAQQENNTRSQGSMRIYTIWGYEEPENNLEMARCFDLANKMLEFSSDIQMFVTTHSPAFYSLAKEKLVNLYYVYQQQQDGKSFFSLYNDNNPIDIDKHMGILPIITPYIKKEIEAYKRDSSEDTPKIYVEGLTDKYYIENAIKILNKDLYAKIENQEIIIESEHNAGSGWVYDRVMARCFLRCKKKTMAILDNDQSGIDTKRKICENEKYTELKHKNLLCIKLLNKFLPQHLIELYKRRIIIPIGIEEFFPHFVWQKADEGGLLDKRDVTKIIDPPNINTTLKDHITTIITDDDLLDYVFLYVNITNKEKFKNLVHNLSEAEKKQAYNTFSSLVQSIEDFFA